MLFGMSELKYVGEESPGRGVSNIQPLTLTFISLAFTFFYKVRQLAKMNSTMILSSKSLQNVLPSVGSQARELPE